MEITEIRQHQLSYDLDGSYEPVWVPGETRETHELNLFEVETDEGITGITAGTAFGGFDYEEVYERFLVGEDPYEIDHILRKLESMDVLDSAPWHLEVALWDIIGKDVNKPIYKLLGGTRREISAYASTAELQPMDRRLDYVADRIEEGYDAVKLRFQSEDPEDDLLLARRVREEFPEITLMIDANKAWCIRISGEEQTWSLKQAISIAHELEEIGNIGWLEEPLPMHNYADLRKLRGQTTIPIAGGGSVSDLHLSKTYLDNDCYDVIQSDVMLATGIQNAKTVASMAKLNGVEYNPHTWGNGIGLAANLHAMVGTRSDWCEYPLEPPSWTPKAQHFMLTESIEPENGQISPPDGPGLGIEIDWESVREYESSA